MYPANAFFTLPVRVLRFSVHTISFAVPTFHTSHEATHRAVSKQKFAFTLKTRGSRWPTMYTVFCKMDCNLRNAATSTTMGPTA